MDIRRFLIENKFYHGSLSTIEKPDSSFSLANPFSDFGAAFYLTSIFSQAKNWGLKKAKEKNINTYKVNQYSFSDVSGLRIVLFEEPDRNWLETVYQGRLGRKLPFDIVIGPVADGQLLKTLNWYGNARKRRERMSESEIEEMEYEAIKGLKVDERMDQYALLNEKALKRLVFEKVYICDIYNGVIRESSPSGLMMENKRRTNKDGRGER